MDDDDVMMRKNYGRNLRWDCRDNMSLSTLRKALLPVL